MSFSLDEFIRALQSMGRIRLSSEIKTDDNNNETDPMVEEQNVKCEPADVSESLSCQSEPKNNDKIN